MEKLNFKSVGMLVGGLAILFLFVNAIPWATKEEVKEIRDDLKKWYPVLQERVGKIELDNGHIKDDVTEIKTDVKEIKEMVRKP